ncbi:MAG: sialidase family protein [Abditibacteriaceae bacterium]
MKSYLRQLIGLLILTAFGSGVLKTIQYHLSTSFQVNSHPELTAQKPLFESDFASTKIHTETHAASLVELKDGRLRAFWFAGTREGARDVQIHSAVFDPRNSKWSAEQVVATRDDTEKSVLRYVSKLGNPVCGRASDGKLWLIYVTVSLGGWSGSSLTVKTSANEGKTWSAARRIITSPFLNVSTLVKGAPFLYSDGTMGLPVYQELNNDFGEILRFDKDGHLIDKQRLSTGTDDGLQPIVLVKNDNDAQVLMRNSGSKYSQQVISVSTKDGGQHWTSPIHLPLFNPNSALSAVMLSHQRILAVVNDQNRQGISKGRDALSLMISADGGSSWKLIYRLEDQLEARKDPLDAASYYNSAKVLASRSANGMMRSAVDAHAESAKSAMCKADNCGFEFSYPYLIQIKNGDFHLVYTWNRSFIKHVWFNQAWIGQQLHQ